MRDRPEVDIIFPDTGKGGVKGVLYVVMYCLSKSIEQIAEQSKPQ